MKQVELNIDELKSFMGHIIKNNQSLQAEGKYPVAVEVIGESGIGKTSSIIQLAQEQDLHVVKLNLAQIEELGDLVGYPVEEFQMVKNTGTAENPEWKQSWVKKPLLEDSRNRGYQATGKSRMGYSAPEWIANKGEGGVLILDDWNRADVRFLQAVMEIVDRQEYISWKLPKNWHIVLTANPDNGDYNVNSIDSAQRTRFISVNLKFDIDVWAKWAEQTGIDGRCINFLLIHPNLVTQDTNARSITKFFEGISSIKDFEKELNMVSMIGDGSVGAEFSSMFAQFIGNRLDKLISPEKMLKHASTKEVIDEIKECVNKDGKYRADIAGALTTRFSNYVLHYAESNTITEKMIERLVDITTEKAFGSDLQFLVASDLVNGNQEKFRKLMMFEQVSKAVLSDGD